MDKYFNVLSDRLPRHVPGPTQLDLPNGSSLAIIELFLNTRRASEIYRAYKGNFAMCLKRAVRSPGQHSTPSEGDGWTAKVALDLAPQVPASGCLLAWYSLVQTLPIRAMSIPFGKLGLPLSLRTQIVDQRPECKDTEPCGFL
jgi:hypothetical protein